MTATSPHSVGLDLAVLRRRLADARGPSYWRSLEELAETPAFTAYLAEEFPHLASARASALDRRRFLQLAAASLALGGLAGCGPEQAPEDMVPNVVDPAGSVAGEPSFFTSATLLGGYATGVLVEHRLGRPMKVEGNPDHPASIGATDLFAQAAILDLYDPDRSQTVSYASRIRSWGDFLSALDERRDSWRTTQGKGLRVLSGAVSSPSLTAQMKALGKLYPEMAWHIWEPVNRDTARAGATLAFGRPLEAIPHLERAQTVLAIESDLLSSAPGHLRFARDFAARRRPTGSGDMLRLYAIESTPSLTGAAADHRFAARPDEVHELLWALAGLVGAIPPEAQGSRGGPPWLAAIADDLQRNRGRALVHVGPEQSSDMHALAHLVNRAIGAEDGMLTFIEPVTAVTEDHASSIGRLIRDMAGGEVDTLLILGGNPAFTAPGDLGFAEALRRVPVAVYWGLHADETARACQWHVPATHVFEAWSDARAFDGTACIIQPQVRPLYNGHSAHELVAALQGNPRPEMLAPVRDFWRAELAAGQAGDFAPAWTEALRRGIVPNSASAPVKPEPQSFRPEPPRSSGGLAVTFRPDPHVWDGRFANNGWLQELPRPLTRVSWDNPALIAPATAERLGLANGDVVTLRAGEHDARVAVWVLPGQAPDCLTLHLGEGRRVAGRIALGVGADVYPIRGAGSPWLRYDVALAKTGARQALATTQHHHAMAGRDLVRVGTLREFKDDPNFLHGENPAESLYPVYDYPGTAWGMQIDLNACLGCGVCALACQAENNVPIVGKDEVMRGREMHWLRIDRYYHGGLDAPDMLFQPVLCMHCEDAPCEVVCPVQATNHDHEGLNVMVYNRCVGTRFCSNNCPYKVRRFNFFAYTESEPRPAEARNPDVTVRSRGVMEKCTYCLQRIAAARIAADRENRGISDGEVVTACQAACPTQAITFGDLHDPNSAVAKRKASPLDYALLAELNTRPRTTYGARLRNPNPAIEDG
jgi:molybdopterin-containing oxidoreductase family iron-sulfur binding subunit